MSDVANVRSLPQTADFLASGGAMGMLLRGHDWSASPLGPPGGWPQPLKTLIGVMLGSNQPMFVVWGPGRTLIYNEAYAEILAAKHPAAIGDDFLDVWHEIRGDLVPIVEQTYAGAPVHMDDITLFMTRRGYVEETHFSFFYAPVRDERGAVAGLYCACNEITGQVQAERRRREAEAALRHERDRTRGVLDSMGEGFGLLDREFRIIDINAEGLRLEKRSRDEIIGKTHWEAWPGTEDSELGRLYKLAMAERVPVSLDHHYVWPGGHDAWLEMRAYPTDDGLALFWRDVTERKRAEARLRDSEARFRLMADAVPQIVWIADADGRTAFFNKQWADYTGDPCPPATTAAMVARHVHPDDATATLSAFEDARRGGRTLLVEHRIRSKTGAYGWFLVRAEPDLDPDTGRIVRWFGASVDIHDRKLAEAAHRESEARLSRALEAGGLGAWEIDLSTQAAWRSLQHDRIFGYEAGMAEWTYDTFLGHVVPEDRDRVDAAFQAALAGSDRCEFESRIRRADGVERWIWVQGRVERTPGDPPGRIKGMVRDITERRAVEEKLRELNETLEAQVAARAAERDRLWNLSQDMLARADYTGMMSAVSPAWTQILGWSEAELLTRGYATFMHPEDMAPTLQAVQRMAETRLPSRFENRIATRDGGWKHIEWTVAPEADGRYFIAVGRDVSLARLRDAELEVARDALRQSQKMEAMGNLTGGVAHDFNNLLAPIMGSLDLLVRRNVGGERERRLIDGALRSAERAKTLVQRLLAFARRQPLQPTAVDVRRLVDDMSGLIGSTVGPTIRVHLDLAADLPAANADQNQLEMALLNLAVNARDAMPAGGELTIRARRKTVQSSVASGLTPGPYVCLSVADTGVGMDKATRDRAIEPFFSTKGIGRGTGLGLSMVHGLAAQLGGGLQIASSPGQGTTVELWLPINTDSVAPDAGPATPVARSAVSRGMALLVDDEELVRMSTADMLGELGFEVVEAGSAEEALRLMKTGTTPDVLLTDHLMPGMSGVALAHEARSLQPTLPVLIVSGYAEVDGIASDLPRLTKPFRNADLAASLAALVPDLAA